MKSTKLTSILLLLLFCLVPTFGSEAEIYQQRFSSIQYLTDIPKAGYTISKAHILTDNFDTTMMQGAYTIYPALQENVGRVALFFVDSSGKVAHKTEDLECNSFFSIGLFQPNILITGIAKRDVNNDGENEILLETYCRYDEKQFKIGDVLFQGSEGLYRDWRISDKINRFDMNKDFDMITAYIRDGQSSEFLYRTDTIAELKKQGFMPLEKQIFEMDFEKFGSVQVIPGSYAMGEQRIFIIYLVNKNGQVVWNFQCMRGYDNFSNMTGISFKDVDGDGWADVSVLAKYNFLDKENQMQYATDFSIYYQREGYFFEDQEFHQVYWKQLTGKEVMNDIVEAARTYWGW